MAPKRPCRNFQLGKCNEEAHCGFAHTVDPTFKRKTCHFFLKGKCKRGNQCGYSHEQVSSEDTNRTNGNTNVASKASRSFEAALKDFRWKIPKSAASMKPLGYGLGKFFQQALELIDGEVEILQEVVKLLASEGGLYRIEELLQQPYSSLHPSQLTAAINHQLLPFFSIFSHPKIVSSILLRERVITVYNVIYTGDGSGTRASSLFTLLAAHLADHRANYASYEEGQPSTEAMQVIEVVLASLSMLVDVNTPAHTDPCFVVIAEKFALLLDDLAQSVSCSIRHARRSLEKIQQRLGIGQSMPNATKKHNRVGTNATFQLTREMPGDLSEQGPRHDNDHVFIRDVSILPTLQEIKSLRNEYLPTANPHEWHLDGAFGLLDRHFRLLREDTVGQIRDAARIELERLQNTSREALKNRQKRQSTRTHVYTDVEIVSAAFDNHHGAQVALRFPQPQTSQVQTKSARQEWWSNTRRLGPDTLFCLLSSESLATFFVVAAQGQKPTQLQNEYSLARDPENAYVVGRPLDDSIFSHLISHALAGTSYAQLSLVEFPGILLPAFEPTLKAIQSRSESLDMPFTNILAPTVTPVRPEQKLDVQPPMYATKPGFKYNLSRITDGHETLYFTPGEDIEKAAAELREKSTLDPGQAEALISCLARSFAVVQGPPGTGKSYTGVQLIRVLLDNKAAGRIGPILVSTQTNHALDAILERSVDDDVENVVRIGGQSRSDRLKDVNLNVLASRLDLTKVESAERWQLKQKVREETDEINQLIKAFGSLCTESAVEKHLEQYYPAYHLQLFEAVDEQGFTTIRREGDGIIDAWLKSTHPSLSHPRSRAELNGINLYTMTMVERWLMFNSWIDEMRNELDQKLAYALTTYHEAKKKLLGVTSELNLRVLRQANIIGVTTSGLARNIELLCGVDAKVLICEEAGEVLEAHMLTALLPSVEHCMLIGDHQQLRPQVQNFDLSSESRAGSQYALDISLFERLVKPQDLFTKPLPFSTLQVQRRMHPSISQLVRQTQYPRLQDDPLVSLYPNVTGMRQRLFWMHHEELEDGKSDSSLNSRTNAFEVNMVVALVRHLAQQGVYKAEDVAVITPYLGQLRKLRNKLSSTHAILLNEKDIHDLEKDVTDPEDDCAPPSHLYVATATKGYLNQAIRIATVDNFQGEEAKVVIISLVRSNKENNPGFLKTPNRINVLLSRAQHGMYILGNTKTTERVPMWHDVMEILRQDNNIGDALELCCPRHPGTPIFVKTPADFARLAPESGCSLLCKQQLRCGHACVSKCHSDMLHEAVYCMKACTRPLKGCEHLCPNPCGAQCEPDCKIIIQDVVVELSCGHVKTDLACYEFLDPSRVICREPTKRIVPGCNHEITVPCCVDVNGEDFACAVSCGELLSCGHICNSLCYQCKPGIKETKETNHGPCMQKCGRAYSTCAHSCRSSCHAGEPCPLCTISCSTCCSHSRCNKICSEPCSPCLEEQCNSGINCPHNEPCIMPCAAPCTWIPCSKRCDQLLSCGCRCPSVCGEECPDAKYCQEHASDDIKAMQVDLLLFASYKDVDLDEDPCIFTSCGHIFTIASLDGTMGMADHYQMDALTGSCIGIKSNAEPFSTHTAKPCPKCRGSLRNIGRYGRIVRRALLDESAKKLAAWSSHRHQDLSLRLAALEAEMIGTVDLPLKPKQDVLLKGSIKAQMAAVKKLKTTKRYGKLYAIVGELNDFTRKLRKEEQPYQRVHDLVEVARRRAVSETKAKYEISSEEIQLRDNLQANNLLIRSYLILFSDVISIHNKTPIGIRGNLRVDFADGREQCHNIIVEAIESRSIRQAIEAHIHWAKFAAMECGSFNVVHEASEPELLKKLDDLKREANGHLNTVEISCALQREKRKIQHNRAEGERGIEPNNIADDPMDILANEAVEVRRMLREGLSSIEMGMVVRAMAREFSGTGHWYRCANGHPFTVGECGMPMELARCPECSAPVGGQQHRATDGVTHAADIEERFSTMEI